MIAQHVVVQCNVIFVLFWRIIIVVYCYLPGNMRETPCLLKLSTCMSAVAYSINSIIFNLLKSKVL